MAMAFIVLLLMVSRYFGLKTTSWLLSNFTGYLIVIIVVIFQPELRRALATLGETSIFFRSKKATIEITDEIVKAAIVLADRQIGALIIIERKDDVEPVVTLGKHLDSIITSDLLVSIFVPYTPLHDGAVIISDSRLSYAGCVLPLTKRRDIPSSFGTRHRAAIGITEETDAVTIVVSEERGIISVVADGVVHTDLNAESLKNMLKKLLAIETTDAPEPDVVKADE
ncbi:membrane protein [Deferribacterales bacterium]|nr:membrane protein [Deferribacterales bacterium]